MNFIDTTGHIFSLTDYSDSIGYELKTPEYIFWIDSPVSDHELSIDTYYIKQITPYINKDSILGLRNPNTQINYIKISLNSERFNIIRYDEINYNSNLEIDLNTISDLQTITYKKDECIIDTEKYDLICPFFVLCKSSDEGTFTVNILIEVNYQDANGNTVSLYSIATLGATFVGEEEKYSININNFGFTIPKGILNAVYQSELNLDNYKGNLNNFDFVLYNSKLREYLLYNKTFKNNKGNYDSIKSHLDWFGWGADLAITKLLRTDNQFLTQYLDRDYSTNNDSNVLIKNFIYSSLINIRLESNEILYKYINKKQFIETEKQDWTGDTDFIGEGIVRTSDLFEKYIPIELEENSLFQYISPYYKYSINIILLKLAFLKYYYKKYFLPVHVDTLSVDVNKRCFINDIKFYSTAKSSFTVPMLLNADNSFVKIGNKLGVDSETIYLTKTKRIINNNYIQYDFVVDHYDELINDTHNAIYEVNELHARIPLSFYKDINEYFLENSKIGYNADPDKEYVYNVNLILSKYNSLTDDYEVVYSKNFIYNKLFGNTDSFIMIPHLNGKNDNVVWYDDEDNLYKLDVCSNGTWFSKVFNIEFPPVNFNLGYLEYAYQEPDENDSPFTQKTLYDHTKTISFMREPDLVTVDNINFSHDVASGLILDGDSIKDNYINNYKDLYNIPSRDTNPELYNIVMYIDVKTDSNLYNSLKEAFKENSNKDNYNNQYNEFYEYYIKDNDLIKDGWDFYFMFSPKQKEDLKDNSNNIEKIYIVFISKYTSENTIYSDYKNKYKISCEEIFKNLILQYNSRHNNQEILRFANIDYRFLINRFKVVPYENNIIDPNKILTCSVSSMYELNVPFNLEQGIKWYFSPYSLVNNQAFNVTSKANIGIVSIPKYQGKHPSGYYDININYSLEGTTTVSKKAPFKILIK